MSRCLLMSVTLTAVVILGTPLIAFACPGCIAANEESRNAFLFTTALLTFVPLIAIAGTVRWLQWRNERRRDQQEDFSDSTPERP